MVACSGSMCGGVQRRVMACSGGVQCAAAACGVWRAACKQVASDGYGKAKTDELLYYSLCVFGVSHAPQTYFDGPSAIRRECLILLKEDTNKASIHHRADILQVCLKPLLSFA